MAIVNVNFQWNDEHGKCYDCGLPAAYVIESIEGEESKRCCGCAASAAADGEHISYLFAAVASR